MNNDISNNKANDLKNFIAVFLIVFFLMVMLFLFRNLYNFDYIILFLTIVIFVFLFKYKSYIFIKYFWAVFYAIFMLCGLFLCNNSDLFLHEIARSSHYNGSFSIGAIYNIIFIISLVFFDNLYSKKYKYYISSEKLQKNKLLNNIIYIAMFLIGMIMLSVVFKHPSFKYNIGTVTYSELYMPSWLSKLQSIYTYCIPILMFPIVYKNRSFRLQDFIKIIVSILPFILFGVWVGNKFGLFFNIFILLLSPLIVYISKKGLVVNKIDNLNIDSKSVPIMKKNIKKIIAFSFIGLVVLLLPYYTLRGLSVADSVFNRTAQQGQLWWATYEVDKNQKMHLDELDDELLPVISSFNGKEVNYTYGVYKIMSITTPESGYIAKLAIGSRYSAQGIEIAYYYFKYIGIVVHAILRGFIEALLVNLLIRYVFSYRFLSSFITARLIIITHSIFTQGDIYLLFSKETILLILLLFFINLVSKKKFKNMKNLIN